ncbi:immediate early response 3-interacting protein 1 [Pancytospora philotis]|nr:immediate early response 3-interacting protein 1 [Pancytospora philotis]
MFGVLSLVYSFVFFLNAVVILNDKRFLARVRLPLAPECRASLGPQRQKVVDIVNTIRTVFELPLIAINILCIVYEVFLG